MVRRTCGLRWSDMDALGHINNSEYLRYLEQARIEFLADAAAAESPVMRACWWRHEVDYRKPMPCRREPVEIPTWVDKIGTTSFTFGWRGGGGRGRHARAITVIVCIDKDNRPTPVPTALRRHLEGFALICGSARVTRSRPPPAARSALSAACIASDSAELIAVATPARRWWVADRRPPVLWPIAAHALGHRRCLRTSRCRAGPAQFVPPSRTG